MLWYVLIYLASLALLFMTAFWQTDTFSLQIVRDFTLDNIKQVFTTPVYRSVAVQTVMIATAVTVLCATLALPVAFFAAKVAKPRSRRLLVVLFLVPLWASYLVKAYAWRVVLSEGGLLSEVLKPLGLNGPGFGTTAIILVLTYLWLPYMILPIYASLDRLPNSLLDASGDLGRTGRSNVPLRGVSDHLARIGRRFGVHFLALDGRLHRRPAGGRQRDTARQPGLQQHRRRR